MPGEPVVVLHTALTAGVARSMDQLLPPAAREPALLHVAGQHHAHRPPSDRTWEPEPAAGRRSWGGGGGVHPAEGQPPTAAVFYSISATQPGLAGVDLGNFLIKQVRQGLSNSGQTFLAEPPEQTGTAACPLASLPPTGPASPLRPPYCAGGA